METGDWKLETETKGDRSLKCRLIAAGIRPSRRLGQNFLLDKNLLAFIAREARILPGEIILEIGPGPGNLTRHLAERADRILAVETDRRLLDIAREELPGAAVGWHAGSILEGGAISPGVLDMLRAAGRPVRVVSNLPYSVATTAIVALLEADIPLREMFVMVQREAGDRLLAVPRTKEYGVTTVLVQAQAVVAHVRDVPASVFWPRPEVASVLIRVTPDPARRRRIRDYPVFRDTVRRAFQGRRKMLGTILRDRWGLTAAAIPPGIRDFASRRPDALSVEEWVILARELHS
ncbi:MAG: 16S rRNA (adenine(1518)-N(6)/adenine(1519)-N(6))-dimethyltransferase RsmA [Planctomycetota bacterium]